MGEGGLSSSSTWLLLIAATSLYRSRNPSLLSVARGSRVLVVKASSERMPLRKFSSSKAVVSKCSGNRK